MSGTPSPQPSRRHVLLAIDPESGTCDLEVLVPTHRLQWAVHMGVGAIEELARSVPAVLAKPTAIYRGIVRDADDDNAGAHPGWLCYVGKPPVRYDYRTGQPRSMADRVLMVYVNEGRVFYHHRWEAEDPDRPGLPLDREQRFKERAL